jgi:hypothetical protein
LQSSIWTWIGFRGLASPFGVASHCPYHCCARVAQGIQGIQTYRCLHLPLPFESSFHNVLDHSGELVSNCEYRSCSLPDLTGHLCCPRSFAVRDTARADGGHAPLLGSLGKPFRLTFILPSTLVRFPVLNSIKPHAAPLVVLPRQFL